jgi:hypothetical protein
VRLSCITLTSIILCMGSPTSGILASDSHRLEVMQPNTWSVTGKRQKRPHCRFILVDDGLLPMGPGDASLSFTGTDRAGGPQPTNSTDTVSLLPSNAALTDASLRFPSDHSNLSPLGTWRRRLTFITVLAHFKPESHFPIGHNDPHLSRL